MASPGLFSECTGALAHTKPPKRAYLLLLVPLLGLCYLSGVVWSKSISTNAADVVAAQRVTLGRHASGTVSLAASTNSSCHPVIKVIPPPKARQDIGLLLQHEGFEVGAELGVAHGVFAAEILWVWRACKRFYLVDDYSKQQQQQQYSTDHAVRRQLAPGQQGHQLQKEDQEEIMQQAHENLQGWQQKCVWMRNTTTTAAALLREPLDYVYVDAQKDYCSVLDDIKAWWPLVKPGGIMAGHSYENAVDAMRQSGQDWSHCPNGIINHGAVQAAVNEFFEQQGLQIVVTYRELQWNSWMVRKPYYPCSDQHRAGAAALRKQEEPLTQLLSMMLAPPQKQEQPQQEPPQGQPQEQQPLQLKDLQQHGQQQQQQQQQQQPLPQHTRSELVLQSHKVSKPAGKRGEDESEQSEQEQQLALQHHISSHQEPQQRHQQARQALLKLHDSKGLAESRAVSRRAAADVFGDILAPHEDT